MFTKDLNSIIRRSPGPPSRNLSLAVSCQSFQVLDLRVLGSLGGSGISSSMRVSGTNVIGSTGGVGVAGIVGAGATGINDVGPKLCGGCTCIGG